MEKLPRNLYVVSCISSRSLDDLRDCLKADHYKIFELQGEQIVDRQSFVNAAAAVLPLDPPIVGGSWDAFEDSLWSGIDELACNRVAVVWKDSEKMVGAALEDFLIIIDCFLKVARSISSPESGASVTTTFRIFLIGAGNSFKPITVSS